MVNFEPPWNPARLEQRIGRVHRLGQSRPVQVIHLLTTGSIEERVWKTLAIKKSLFAGVFDSPVAEVSFAALGKKSMLQDLKEIFADQPGRSKPVIDQLGPAPVPVKAAAAAPPAEPFAQAAAGAKPGNLESAAAGPDRSGREIPRVDGYGFGPTGAGHLRAPGFARRAHQPASALDSVAGGPDSGAAQRRSGESAEGAEGIALPATPARSVLKGAGVPVWRRYVGVPRLIPMFELLLGGL